MPKLIKLYIVHSAIGFALAAVFVAMLMYFNVMNLAHLVMHTEGGFLALLVLWVSNGIVFAGVQFGIAIMRMADDDDDEPRGGKRFMARAPEPIPVRVAAGGPRGPNQRRNRR